MATRLGSWGSSARRLGGLTAVVVGVLWCRPAAAQAPADPEAVGKAFAAFWAAENPESAARRVGLKLPSPTEAVAKYG